MKTDQSPFLGTATPLTDTMTDRQTQGKTEDGLYSGTDLNSCSRQAKDRKPGEREVENLNLDSLLLKCFQGGVLLFLSFLNTTPMHYW